MKLSNIDLITNSKATKVLNKGGLLQIRENYEKRLSQSKTISSFPPFWWHQNLNFEIPRVLLLSLQDL